MAQPKNINNAILSVLESIDAKIEAQGQQTQKLNTDIKGMAASGVVSQEEFNDFAKFFGKIAKGIKALVKSMDKVSDKTGEKFKKLVLDIGETIQEFFGMADQKQVETFTNMLAVLGKGVFLYALAIVVSIPLLLLAPIGAFLFGLSIRILMMAMGTAGIGGGKKIMAMQAILDMAHGIILFALAMVVVVLLSPAMILGAVVFGLTMRILFGILFGGSTVADVKTLIAMNMILDMAKGIMLFGLAMVVVTLLTPFMLIGAIVFGLSVRLLMLMMGRMTVKKLLGMYLILQMAKGAILFALGMALIALLAPLFVKGVLLFAGSILLMLLVMRFASSKQSMKGVLALVVISLVVLLWALLFPLFDAMVTYAAAFKVALTFLLVGLVLGLLGLGAKFIKKGAIAMAFAAMPIILIGIAMMIWKAAKVEIMDVVGLAATIIVIGLIGLVAGLGPIPGFIAAGSAALLLGAAAVLVLSVAMMLWMASKVKMKDVGILGATILMLGVEFAAFGFLAPFILIGSAAMLVTAIPLMLITGALAVFKSAGWKKKDGDMLENALGSVVNAFMGGPMPGGILAAIKFAAKAAARAALMFITVPPFILAGLALIPIAKSLQMFKAAKWTPKDSDNMEKVMAAIISSFALPSDYARQKELGIYVTPWRLMLGIYALRNAGDTMASLAQGIQAFANLTVPIYGWVDKEGGGSLEIIERRQMSEGDFDKAAYGMATVISAIAKPFAEVGRLEAGESSGNPVLDYIFSGNFVSKGVSALKNAGATIVGLAEGVQAFAELTIPEYGLVDYTDENGNPAKKLMVIARKPMGEDQIKAASENISMVIGVIAKALAEVGEMEDKSSGWFSGGYVSKGSKALAGAGNNIKAIAEVVANYAKLQHTPMEVVGAGTKDQKLVPGKPIKVTKAEIMAAANTISDVLGVMVKKMAYIGEMESKGGWFFKNNYVKKGVQAIAGMGQNIGAIADAVFKFATGTFTPMKMNNKGELVPAGAPQKVGRSQIMAAAGTIKSLIWSFGTGFHEFGMWADAGPGTKYIDLTMDLIGDMSSGVNKITAMIKKIHDVGLEQFQTAGDAIVNLLNRLRDVFDSAKYPEIERIRVLFNTFRYNIVEIAREAAGIVKAAGGYTTMASATEKYVNSINKIKRPQVTDLYWLNKTYANPKAWIGAKSISISHVRLREQINGLDIDRLKILNSLMCALAKLGNANVGLDRLGEEIGEGMKEGFELLAEYLKQIMAEAGGGGGGTDAEGNPVPGPAGDTAGGGAGGGGGSKPAKASKPAGGDIARALKSALQSVTVTVKPAATAVGKFS